jgi:hypothetical protein
MFWFNCCFDDSAEEHYSTFAVCVPLKSNGRRTIANLVVASYQQVYMPG